MGRDPDPRKKVEPSWPLPNGEAEDGVDGLFRDLQLLEVSLPADFETHDHGSLRAADKR